MTVVLFQTCWHTFLKFWQKRKQFRSMIKAKFEICAPVSLSGKTLRNVLWNLRHSMKILLRERSFSFIKFHDYGATRMKKTFSLIYQFCYKEKSVSATFMNIYTNCNGKLWSKKNSSDVSLVSCSGITEHPTLFYMDVGCL